MNHLSNSYLYSLFHFWDAKCWQKLIQFEIVIKFAIIFFGSTHIHITCFYFLSKLKCLCIFFPFSSIQSLILCFLNIHISYIIRRVEFQWVNFVYLSFYWGGRRMFRYVHVLSSSERKSQGIFQGLGILLDKTCDIFIVLLHWNLEKKILPCQYEGFW